MRPRLLGLLALVLALLLHAASVAPARRQLEAYARQHRELSEARRRASEQQLARSAAERRARAWLERALPSRGPDPVIGLRAALVRLLDGRPLRDVKLQVQQRRGETEFQLSAVGPYDAVVPFAGELARLPQAVILESVTARPSAGEVAFELGGRLAAAPR